MTVLPLQPSEMVAVFSTSPLIPLGLEVELVPLSSWLLASAPSIRNLSSDHALCHLGTSYRSFLPYSALNSPWSFKNLVSVSLSASTPFHLQFLRISVSTKMILPVSWPLSSLAELEGFSIIFLLFCLSCNFWLVITSNSESSMISNL